MSDLASLLQPFLAGGVASAVILGIVRIAAKYIEHHKSSSETRMDDASTADTVSKTYERIVKDLRNERLADRLDLVDLRNKYQALNDRMDRNTTTAREARDRAEASEVRSERNIRALSKHIVKLSDLMRAAGLTPPDPPILEQEPPRYERQDLHDAIPRLMSGGVASFGAKPPRDDADDE